MPNPNPLAGAEFTLYQDNPPTGGTRGDEARLRLPANGESRRVAGERVGVAGVNVGHEGTHRRGQAGGVPCLFALLLVVIAVELIIP